MIFKIAFLFATLSATAFANDLTVKVTLSPAGSFEAKTTKMHGDITKNADKYSASNLWIKTEDLKSDNDLRDEHLHKHLNFDKFPKITLTDVQASAGKGSGTLTVSGVPTKIEFTYTNVSEKQLRANFKVKTSVFKLKEVKYMEIGVDDEVEIVATVDVK